MWRRHGSDYERALRFSLYDAAERVVVFPRRKHAWERSPATHRDGVEGGRCETISVFSRVNERGTTGAIFRSCSSFGGWHNTHVRLLREGSEAASERTHHFGYDYCRSMLRTWIPVHIFNKSSRAVLFPLFSGTSRKDDSSSCRQGYYTFEIFQEFLRSGAQSAKPLSYPESL